MHNKPSPSDNYSSETEKKEKVSRDKVVWVGHYGPANSTKVRAYKGKSDRRREIKYRREQKAMQLARLKGD